MSLPLIGTFMLAFLNWNNDWEEETMADDSGSGYQLLDHDDSKFTIQHPDGSTFDVAKSGLDPATSDKILGLPTPNASPVSDSPDSIAEDANAGTGGAGSGAISDIPPSSPTPESIPANSGQSIADTAKQFQANNPELAAQNPQTGTGPNQINPAGPNDIMGIYGQALKGQTEALQGIGESKGAEGKAAAAAYGQYAARSQQLAQTQADNMTKLQTEGDSLQKAVQNGQIDPDKYWNSRTSGQKASAIVSVILGGIGGGMSGTGQNVALQMLNDHVNKDIDSQKVDLGKKETLYSQNLAKYGQERAATAATQLQYNNALQAKLGMAAAQSGSQQAQFQAQAAIAGLKGQQIPLMQQIAMMQTNSKLYGQQTGDGGLPVGGEPMQLLSDPKYQEKRIVVGNKAYQAPSPDDAKDLKNLQAEYEPVKNVVGQLTALQGNPKALVSGTPENLQAQALRAYAVPRLNNMHGLSRLSEEDVKLMGDQLSDPTKFNQFLAGQTKNDTFMRNLNDDLDSNYKTRLIGYQGNAQYPSFKPST
jgi:hypothetical protein